jgi:seryl-tRNA synthetase
MDIEAKINEKIARLQDLNRQMGEISKQIGALQEQGRALHGAALEVKGAIEGLAELKQDEDASAAEKKSLILPDKTLVAADGKTVIATPEAEAPVAETPAAPVLDVVQ